MIHAALDTSLAAALAVADDDRLLASRALAVRGRASDEELVPWLLDTLAGLGLGLGGIERWTVGTGPGSFSGIRVGVSWVLGVCAGTGAAVRGVPSSLALACEAADVAPGQCVGVLHDARQKQIILSTYRRLATGWQTAGEPAVMLPQALPTEQHALFVTAQDSVASLVGGALGARLRRVPALDARHLVAADWPWPGDHPATLASIEPVYVRPAVFAKPRPVP